MLSLPNYRAHCALFSRQVFSISVPAFAALMAVLPAAAQVAPGVQQSAAQTANISGTVLQSNGGPVAGADVRLLGPATLRTKSDVRGTFQFVSVPRGTYQIVVTSQLGATSKNDVAINGDVNLEIRYAAQPGVLKTIASVSTRSAGAQINVTPASIASINPSDYAFRGNTSWRELLNAIPGVTVGGALDGGSSDYNTIPDFPFTPVILSINGALPYETATTLDGMPLINTSVTTAAGNGSNLSYLPMPSFDTADVVRGPGANAPSIVDSIGGSFVLHPPGRVDKNHFEFSASNDPYGGTVSNAKASFRFGRFSASLVYGANVSPGPVGTQQIIPGYANAPLTVNGQPFLGCTPPGCFGFYAPNFAKYANPYFELQNSLLFCCVSLNTSWIQHTGAVGLSYDVTPSITAQVFYAGSQAAMQLPDVNFKVHFAPGPGYTGSVAPGTYTLNQGIVPEPVSQAASLLEEKITGYFGRSVVRLAALQSTSYTDQNITNIFQPDGQYTVFGTGFLGTSPPGTPVVFNGSPEDLTFLKLGLDQHYWVNNRDLLASFATQIGTSANAGISYVTSYYNDPGEIVLTIGQPTGPPLKISSGNPTSVSEVTNELRIHAGADISRKFALDASWYFAEAAYHVPNPSDPSGNTFTDAAFRYNAPHVGATWRANPDLVIRMAAGGGFGLAPLSQLVGSNGAPNCSAGICSQSLTNLNLKPEESFGFDIGTDLRLHRDTVLSFDLYRTNLYGQFFQSTNPAGTFQGLPLYVTQTQNLGKSRYEGINLDVRHDVTKGIYWHGAVGFTRAYVVSVPPGFYDDPTVPCTKCVNTYIVPGINFNGQYPSTVPYANASAQVGYRWAPEKYVELSPTYYGNGNPYFQPAFIALDANAGYSLTRNFSLLATFRNITGVYGQNFQVLTPSTGAPVITGLPYAQFGLPYGPRSLVLTANYKY